MSEEQFNKLEDFTFEETKKQHKVGN